MEQKVAIYFYKNIFSQNKYLSTGSANGAQGTDLLLNSATEHVYKKIPKLNLGKYALIDGIVFKI